MSSKFRSCVNLSGDPDEISFVVDAPKFAERVTNALRAHTDSYLDALTALIHIVIIWA